MAGYESHQLLTNTQFRHLAVSGGYSAAVNTEGFASTVFLANVATAGAIALQIQESLDGSTGWTDLVPAYYKAAGMTLAAQGDSTNGLKVSTTTTASNQLVAVSLYHAGREASIGAGIKPYLRVKVTGTAAYVVALLGLASWKPVDQPDFAIAETKGTVG
jgi:hypothetical protein